MRWLMVLNVVLLIGCANLVDVAAPRPAQSGADEWSWIAVGDRVEVTTTDGQHHAFQVEARNDQELVGRAIRLRFDQIRTIERQNVARDSAIFVGGSYLVYLAFTVFTTAIVMLAL